MKRDAKIFAVVTLAGLLIGAFLFGRHEEMARVAAESARLALSAPEEAVASEMRGAPDYRQLPIQEILALPFTQFYEALRSAPRAARAEWAIELEKMPRGPRQTAALCAFYKLLVQFDPQQAAQAIGNYKGEFGRWAALDAMVSAAPTSAMPKIAEFLASLEDRKLRSSKFGDVIYEWSLTDPGAAVKFLEAHPDQTDYISSGDFIANWAALDPQAARDWLDHHPSEGDPHNPDPFIEGWYESDRPAAVKYVLEHATELASVRTLGAVYSGLYGDARDDARKFFDALPNDELRRSVIKEFADSASFRTAVETGEPEATPRVFAEWITQLSPKYWEGELSKVFRIWSRTSPQELVDWITQQPVEIRGAIADEFVKDDDKSFDETLRPVFHIADSQIRDRLLVAVFKRIGMSVDDVAQDLKQSSLSPTERNHVLEIVAQITAARKTVIQDESDQGSEK